MLCFDDGVSNETTIAGRLNDKLRRLAIALLLVWVVLNGFRPVMDNVDLGWQVAQGRWMVYFSSLYNHDLLNYPNLGRPIVNEYPVFQVVLYFFWSLGWWGPCLLTAALYAWLVGALVRASGDFGLEKSSLPALAIGLMLLFLQIAAPLRPHLVTFLCVTLLGIFLLRHRDTTNWLVFWPMALMQIIWTNCHSGFVLGPGMVGLFGAEMVIRHAARTRTIPWQTLRTWLAAFLLILLACLVNPYGWDRFWLPFYQDRMEAGRAYVGEMQPLAGGLAVLYAEMTIIASILILLALLFRRGAISLAFLLLAVFFFFQAESVRKAWPIFALFLPLLVLSTGAFARSAMLRVTATWPAVIGHAIVSVLLLSAVYMELGPSWPTSLATLWREHDRGRTELSVDAANWLKAHHLHGKLFHRDEDGGLLQMDGFTAGETFSDTGFGKFDETFIHTIGLVDERPPLLPHYLGVYRPEFVICSTFCFQWPWYLRQSGWRPVFYSPNSSVWVPAAAHPELPTVTGDDIAAAFTRDLAANGLPLDTRLLGRNLIALQSLGLEDFAFAQLTALPKDFHHAPWYWEAARFLCFSDPPFSAAHRAALLAEARQLDSPVTAEFRAYAAHAGGDVDTARHILEAIPPQQLGNYSAELLLKIYLDHHNQNALPLARRAGSFDLRNGRHWQYLAIAEEQGGSLPAAAHAWSEAVYYFPDDPALMDAARDFAARHHDTALQQQIDASRPAPGAP